ncbi:MAG: ABC transporter substrate-binding protein [Pseudomonadota bacterium]
MKKSFVLTFIFLFCLGLRTPGLAQKSIRIGSLTSLTGGLAPFGPPINYGAGLAIDHINAAGGLLGRKVELITRDTATSPVVGRDAATKLVEIDKVPAFVGALSNGVTIASSSVTIANQVVQISPASTSPELTDLDDKGFVFRTCPSDALQGVIQATLAKNLGYETSSVIFVNNGYGKGLAEAFKRAFEEKGGQIIVMVPYDQGKASYRGEMGTAIRGKPAVLNIIAYPLDGNKLLMEAVELGYQGRYIFPDGMKGDAVSRGPASKYIDGSFGTAPGALEVAAVKQFEKDYVEKLKKDGIDEKKIRYYVTVPFRTQSYDAIALIALAIQKVGPKFLEMSFREQGKAIRDNLHSVANPPGWNVSYNQFAEAFKLLKAGKDINYQGVSGPITFDENGDVKEAAIEIWHVRNGKTLSIWTVTLEK